MDEAEDASAIDHGGKGRARDALLHACADTSERADLPGAPSERALTIDEVLDLAGFGRFQLRLQAISGLGYMADTAELLFVTFLLPEFARLWPHLTRAQLALVPALSALGTLVAAPLWGVASDVFGRRVVFLGSMGLMAFAGLASAAAPAFWPFVAARVLVGAGLGGALAVDFVVFVEYVPARQRGVSTMLITLWGVAGVLYVGATARLLLPTLGWRCYCASAALPSCALLLARFWVAESPRFLLLRGRADEAARVLRAVAATNGRSAALPVRLTLAPLPPPPALGELLRTLLRAPHARPLLLLSCVWCGLSCAYAGFTFWLPTFLAAKSVRGLDVYETFLLMTAAEVPGLLLATAAIDRVGRRGVLSATLIGCALALAAFSAASSHAALVRCSSASYFAVVGSWATLYTLTPESFPTPVRATAAGITRMCACVGTALAAPLGSALLGVGASAPLVAYAAMLGACALLVLAVPSETRLRPLSDGAPTARASLARVGEAEGGHLADRQAVDGAARGAAARSEADSADRAMPPSPALAARVDA
ncbi:hypothetical protein KFE25_006387 [Diacronema lutheri]|uniref:Major facilitator superfamily (MFS) profile domain-containing protein n=2 Tax=Diacronema lutheri TaxID=2081491 RepID=A0A8J5XWH7_DIALT|nr:hypothetical protein KFE25_006387 [Diacronema lutheri]